MTGVRIMEQVSRHCALGIRFWDIAGATSTVEGLEVEIYPRANPHARSVALPNRSGVYVAHTVPNLRRFESSNDAPDVLWATALRPYRVKVNDPKRRFLSIEFDADLPSRGLFTWLAPWMSPPQPIVLPGEEGSPPPWLLERVPLFSAPSRPVPEPLAVVYAQLREFGGTRAAAWSLLGVGIDGRTRGLGLADEQGRVAVMFPYPEPPRMQLASPPEARNDFGWQLELTAFWSQASPAPAVPAFADLGAVLEQLSQPRSVIESTLSPALPLRLDYRVPVTARTAGVPPQDASYLFVA